LYGSEIGIVGDTRHGTIRTPFPGGFSKDNRSAFDESQRTDSEKKLFNFLKKLITLRKNYPSLKYGQLVHFYPFNNVYVYFRILGSEKIMIVINGNEEDKIVNLNNYNETIGERNILLELFSNKKIILDELKEISIPKKSARIFLLNK
jgi:glycosidase